MGLTADPDGGKLSDPGGGGTWTGTPLPARSGVVAATSAFDTGFAFGYFQRQHVGATAWFLMAAQNFNPLARDPQKSRVTGPRPGVSSGRITSRAMTITGSPARPRAGPPSAPASPCWCG